MFFPKDFQLNLVQIGVMMAKFFPEGIPQDLEEVAQVAFDELGVEIKKGDDLEKVRDRISDALDAVKKL